jgi:hypothetical protein
MTSVPSAQPAKSSPQPNVYTVLLILAAAALLVTLVVVMHSLMAAPPSGYGLSFEDLFKPFQKPSVPSAP